jgi:hypothetical protein
LLGLVDALGMVDTAPQPIRKLAADEVDRFLSHVQRRPPGVVPACWAWTASRYKDYGRFFVDTRPMLAHRVSWRIFRGELPEAPLDHLCARWPGGLGRCCVNPWHLQESSILENSTAAWPLGSAGCKRGHPWSDLTIETRRRDGRAIRRCRRCIMIRHRLRDRGILRGHPDYEAQFSMWDALLAPQFASAIVESARVMAG